MQRFANTRDFQVALLQVIRQANEPRPSRHVIAGQLESLAEKLGATRKKSPGTRRRSPKTEVPTLSPVQQRALVNVGKEEERALEHLGFLLSDALADIKSEVRAIEDSIDRLKDDAKMDGIVPDGDRLDAAWWENTRWLAGQIIDVFSRGVEHLAEQLESRVHLTQEHDLAKAVKDFSHRIPKKYGGDWPEGKGEKLFQDVQKAITTAIAKVPAGLSKASDLAKLRDTFEAIAEAIKLMTGTSITVPKIPNAPDPDDPRQLGFGFAASRRIANTQELRARLDVVWQTASRASPSRQVLGQALFAVADRLR